MSSKSKKKNPRSDPELKAIKQKAYDAGKEDGFELGAKAFLDMALYTFNDLDVTDEWLEMFHDRFMSAWDSRVIYPRLTSERS